MTSDVLPSLLMDFIRQPEDYVMRVGNVVGYPRHWQVPAATEKTAFEIIAPRADSLDFIYVGAPWATLIDGLRHDAPQMSEILGALVAMTATLPSVEATRRATVAQHIHASRFIDIYRACGITDLFWSHATVTEREKGGVRIHPFPLFPAQTPDGGAGCDIHRPRRCLANFIGAYNPRIYLSDVREHIFGDAGRADDLLIVKRDAWHFDRAVYREQMNGIPPDVARLEIEAEHKAEYLTAIRDSVFTLCPTGSGPNSIRISEALALGSIPIILTRDLALPGDRAIWEAACLIEDDSEDGYRRALSWARSMSPAEVARRQASTQDLFAVVGPPAYGDLIVAAVADITTR